MAKRKKTNRMQSWASLTGETSREHSIRTDGEYRYFTLHGLKAAANACGIGFPYWVTANPEFRTSRGMYRVPLWYSAVKGKRTPRSIVTDVGTVPRAEKVERVVAQADRPSLMGAGLSAPPEGSEVMATVTGVPIRDGMDRARGMVPATDPYYVPFGSHDIIHDLIKSGIFAPAYITGMPGNGKTHTVEQVCATIGRECIRINITCDTDEDDLLGGFRLVSGETVFVKGPVVEAMERGAVLLIDEIDMATPKIMCLQPILEGKTAVVKRAGITVVPRPGFNVIACANTRGVGDVETGRFIGAHAQNEALLDRFALMIDQQYPPMIVETTILKNVARGMTGEVPDKFIDAIVKTAEMVRQKYLECGEGDILTTRRNIHIIKLWAVTRDELKAFTLGIGRFDRPTREAMMTVFKAHHDSKVQSTAFSSMKVESFGFGAKPPF